LGTAATWGTRGRVLTPRQLRAARVLLGWTRERLSAASGVPLRTLEAFEQRRTDSKLTTAGKWERALAKAGVVLIPADGTAGAGVRFAEPFATGPGKRAMPRRTRAARAAKRRAKAGPGE
jgi:hypothetical protein